MGKCIFTGEETSNLCYILGKDVFLMKEMEQLINDIANALDISIRKSLYEQLVNKTKIHDTKSVEFLMIVKNACIIQPEKDGLLNKVELNGKTNKKREDISITKTDTKYEDISIIETKETQSDEINGRNIELKTNPKKPFNLSYMRERDSQYGGRVDRAEVLFNVLSIIEILLFAISGIICSVLIDPIFILVIFLGPILVVVTYIMTVFIFELCRNQANTRNEIENIRINMHNKDVDMERLSDNLEQILEELKKLNNKDIQ